ncbi:hypothetical protein O3M35_006975 [Rhynocoris fuscipes]|uniref:Uncharacterized protein n=1 Tax=Rhynocoris fuscipes TaxID=488301 RepID=A0AAW1DI42_9HEMI
MDDNENLKRKSHEPRSSTESSKEYEKALNDNIPKESSIQEAASYQNVNSIYKSGDDVNDDLSVHESWATRLKFVPGMIESRCPYYPPPIEINKQIAANRLSKLKPKRSFKVTETSCMRMTPSNIPIGAEVIDCKPSGYNYACTLGSVYRNLHRVTYHEVEYIKDRKHEKSLLRQERRLERKRVSCKCKSCRDDDQTCGIKEDEVTELTGRQRCCSVEEKKTPGKKYITTKVIIPTFGGDFVVKQLISFDSDWKPPLRARLVDSLKSDSQSSILKKRHKKTLMKRKDTIGKESASRDSSFSYVKPFCSRILSWIKSLHPAKKDRRSRETLIVSYMDKSINVNYDETIDDDAEIGGKYFSGKRNQQMRRLSDLKDEQNSPSTSNNFRANLQQSPGRRQIDKNLPKSN